jgi:hypothetical protein
MYLLYVDESGQAKGRKAGSSTYYVLAGMSLHEEDCWPFSRSLDSIQRAHLKGPDAELELHASRMWAGRHEWARVPQKDRHRLLKAVLKHLGTWQSKDGRRPRFFAAAIHKPSFLGRSVLERAHEELFTRFDSCIVRFHLAGDSHRALIVADESSYEHLVQKLVPEWKRTGSRIRKLHSLIEVPLYVDSKASRLIQAADFVAWATWHYYEYNNPRFVQEINDCFDADGGIQHGLMHLIKGYGSCKCVACASRRDLVVASAVPKF